MISRYTTPEMALLWSEERRAATWLRVELLALRAMEEEGTVPAGTYAEVASKAKADPARAAEIEAEVRHDVIAFLTAVSESAGPSARFLHRGMTSNDLLDTALGVLLKEAGLLLLSASDRLYDVLRARAEEHRATPCVGRSHGIHAEPMSFGVKLLGFAAEILRRRSLLARAVRAVSVGKIAGAVGTNASVSPGVEAHVLGELGLGRDEVPTQVVGRDRHAEFLSALSLLGAAVERLAVELRHLQRTEVAEVEEGFAPGQKGSSAMPHKKNPISAENVTGLARLLRGYALPAAENVALWHERDISHSSVERVVIPDACTVAHYMLVRTADLVERLVVNTERMAVNLAMTRGLVYSGTLLIALADAGMSRESAYRLVQRHAMSVGPDGPTFGELCGADPEIVRALGRDGLDRVFSVGPHLAHVDRAFDAVRRAESAVRDEEKDLFPEVP